MKTEIVHTKGKEVFTDSKVIADMLEVPHTNLLRTIKKIVTRIENTPHAGGVKFPQKYIKTTFINKMGREYEVFEINESAYLKLAMQLSGYEKAEVVQDQIIEAFAMMKDIINNQQNNTWIEKRSEAKQIRQNETDVIKEFIDYAMDQGSRSASKYYMNITKMTNKALELLMQTNEYKPLRDLATITELGFIQMLDYRATLAIQDGMIRKLPYKEIYRYAKEEVEKLADSLAFKRIK
jgi:phage regulator Rha-like protein